MFRRSSEQNRRLEGTPERVDSVLGPGIAWQGNLNGTGGLRIEGAFDGEIALRGLVVIGPQGRVTCEHLLANTVVIAGSVKGDITAHKVEITSTGRVWGNVTTLAFSTQEGAFLRGQITMEDELDLGLPAAPHDEEPPIPAEAPPTVGETHDADAADDNPEKII